MSHGFAFMICPHCHTHPLLDPISLLRNKAQVILLQKTFVFDCLVPSGFKVSGSICASNLLRMTLVTFVFGLTASRPLVQEPCLAVFSMINELMPHNKWRNVHNQ